MMLARFPYGGIERTEIVDWCASAVLWAQKQPDIDGGLKLWRIIGYPGDNVPEQSRPGRHREQHRHPGA